MNCAPIPTKKLNCESDLEILLTSTDILKEAERWTIIFFTGDASCIAPRRYVTASYDGEEYRNCRPAEDGALLCFFRRPALGVGQLCYKIYLGVADENFAPNLRDEVVPVYTPYEIGPWPSDDVQCELDLLVVSGVLVNAEITDVSVETLEPGSEATVEMGGTPSRRTLHFGIPEGMPGKDGAAAGFGDVTATVDAKTGIPEVVVTTSGPDTAKNFTFEFHNLKGSELVGVSAETLPAGSAATATLGGTPEERTIAFGIPEGVPAGFGEVTSETDRETGIPWVDVTIDGPNTAKNIHFSFHRLTPSITADEKGNIYSNDTLVSTVIPDTISKLWNKTHINPTQKPILAEMWADMQDEAAAIVHIASVWKVDTAEFGAATEKADDAYRHYTAAQPDLIAIEADYGDLAAWYAAKTKALNAVADAMKKGIDDEIARIDGILQSLGTEVVASIDAVTPASEDVALNYTQSSREADTGEFAQAPASVSIPAATATQAGVMGSTAFRKLDDINAALDSLSNTQDTDTVTITANKHAYDKEASAWKDGDISTTIPAATTEKAGAMTAKEMRRSTGIISYIDNISNVPDAESVALNVSRHDWNDTDGTWLDMPGTEATRIPPASQTSAGVLSASDKTSLDELTQMKSVLGGKVITSLDDFVKGYENQMELHYDFVEKKGDKWVTDTDYVTFYAASKNGAGLMTGTDKSRLDGIESVVSAAADGFIHSTTDATTSFTIRTFDAKSKTWSEQEKTLTIYAASTVLAGLLLPGDKTKIDNIASDISGALSEAKTYADTQIGAHNTSSTAHADIRTLLAGSTVLPSWDQATYKLTFKTNAGSTLVVDLPIEKMDLRYNAETQSIEWDNGDGSVSSVPVSEFVKEYVGSNGAQITVSIGEGNTIQASVVNNSLSWDMLNSALQQKIDAKADKTWVDDESLPARVAASLGTRFVVGNFSPSANDTNVTVGVQYGTRGSTSDVFTIQNGSFTIPAATTEKAGAMTAKEMRRSTGIISYIDNISNVPDAESVALNVSRHDWNDTDGTWLDMPGTEATRIPPASQTSAGVLSASDKTSLDELTQMKSVLGGKVITSLDDFVKGYENQMELHYDFVEKKGDKWVTDTDYVTFYAASKNGAGLMTGTDKSRLDGIESVVSAAADGFIHSTTDATTSFTIRTFDAKSKTWSEQEKTLTIYAASTVLAGLLLPGDKTKIDNIASDISGALSEAKTYADTQIGAHNTSSTAHADIRTLLAGSTVLPSWDQATYKLTFKTNAGSTLVVDLPIEKMDLRYNAETQSIEWDNGDGSVSSVPVSEFVKEYVGSNGAQITVSIGEGNTIQASVVNNSLSWDMLNSALQQKIDAKADKTWVDDESLPARVAASLGTRFVVGNFSPSANDTNVTVGVQYGTRGSTSDVFTIQNGSFTIPAATTEKAGAMTAADKQKIDQAVTGGPYLPLSGGTMAGDIIIPNKWYLRYSSVSGGGMVFYNGTNTVLGGIGAGTTKPTNIRSIADPTVEIPNSGTYSIWHSGNLKNLSQLNNDPGYIAGVNLNVAATALGADVAPTVAWDAGANKLTFGIPAGPRGPQGPAGEGYTMKGRVIKDQYAGIYNVEINEQIMFYGGFTSGATLNIVAPSDVNLAYKQSLDTIVMWYGAIMPNIAKGSNISYMINNWGSSASMPPSGQGSAHVMTVHYIPYGTSTSYLVILNYCGYTIM